MSRYTGRGAQRHVQAKFGFVSIAALLCLSTAPRLLAEQAGPLPTEQSQKSKSEPEQTPKAAPPPAETGKKEADIKLPTVKVEPSRKPAAKKVLAAPPKAAPKRLPPAQPK